jgi:hypothetical protein
MPMSERTRTRMLVSRSNGVRGEGMRLVRMGSYFARTLVALEPRCGGDVAKGLAKPQVFQ